MMADELLAAQRLIRRIPVGESVVEAILKPRALRPAGDDARRGEPYRLGPRPAREPGADARRARARADRRAAAPSVDDVVALAQPVLRHRMALTFAARADGVTMAQLIDRLVAPLR